MELELTQFQSTRKVKFRIDRGKDSGGNIPSSSFMGFILINTNFLFSEFCFCKCLVVFHYHCVFGQLTISMNLKVEWEIEVGHWILSYALAMKAMNILLRQGLNSAVRT